MNTKDFKSIYNAILLADQGNIAGSIKLLELNREDPFCLVLCKYLKRTGKFAREETVFKNVSPYDAFVKTNYYKKHEKVILEQVENFARRNPPPDNRYVSILDVGCGNGILTAKIVDKVVELYDLENINLILLDPFENMLSAAVKNCKSRIGTDLSITTICANIQDVNQEIIQEIIKNKPIWFTNACLSIHHMPYEDKIDVLKLFSLFSDHSILVDTNWNNDITEKDSPELIRSVVEGYGFLFKEIMESTITDEEKEACINQFLLAEAINILSEERQNRIDYHTTIDKWEEIVCKAGGSVALVRPTVVQPDGKASGFFMEVRNGNK